MKAKHMNCDQLGVCQQRTPACTGCTAGTVEGPCKSKRPANPGYDELSSPWFLGVMGVSVLVLFIDYLDVWRAVMAALQRMLGA